VAENSDKKIAAETESVDVVTAGGPESTSRRDFIKAAGIGTTGLAVFSLIGGAGKVSAQGTVYMPNAKMMVVHDANRCVGCRRCEVACTLSHDNKIQPSISRVKLARNYNFGPDGPRLGWTNGEGLYGNFRLIADTCLQCAHPTPCATACPQGAIEVAPGTNARVINKAKCIGCGTCTKACPWMMASLDTEAKKATKCDLCGGDPKCVKICPAGALSYVPWTDRGKDMQPRQAVPAYVAAGPGVAESCNSCHTSGTVTP
jgi:Fe-S-cluster-containing dehydrogenase component